MGIEMTPLQQAAQALIYRWDTADWKSTKHTADYVNALRKALADEQAQQVAVPASVLDAISRAGFMLVKTQSGYSLIPTSRIEAQGEKPETEIPASATKTDWSAA